MTLQTSDLQRIGFISTEQYESVLNTLKSDLTGKYACGGKTGGALTAEGARKIYDYFKSYRPDVEMWTTHCSVGTYPPKVDLTPQMPPVFDQGNRGTCVAQAVTALANYYFGKSPVLSAEYTFFVLKKYEHEEYTKALRVFLNDPLKYRTQAAAILDRLDFEKQESVGSSGWYLKYYFPYILQEQYKFRLQNTGNSAPLTAEETYETLLEADPADNDGSYLKVAYHVFQNEGFCSYDVLPYSQQALSYSQQALTYSQQVKNGNNGHLPPEAIQDASTRKIQDELRLLHSPGSIDEIKKFLSGNNGQWEPMPVALSLPCFPSWLHNPFTRRTGWFSMPVPVTEKFEECAEMLVQKYKKKHPEATQEQLQEEYQKTLNALNNNPRGTILELLEDRDGGHAMLAVGYKDEPLVAGGGYLIVRNSWNTQWAWDSEQRGHAKIPYAYIECFCDEALSIIKPVQQKAAKTAVTAKADAQAERPEMVLPPSEISLILLTDDSETRREAYHLTHRLLKDGYSLHLEPERLPEGKLKEHLTQRPDNTRDIILLTGGSGLLNGTADQLGKRIMQLATGKNIISLQLGKNNAAPVNQLPEDSRRLVTYNRIRIGEDAFEEDFSKLKNRLTSSPLNNSRKNQELFKAFRKALKANSVKITDDQGNESIPDLYALLKKNLSFRMLDAFAHYLLRRGFQALDNLGNKLTPAEVAPKIKEVAENEINFVSPVSTDAFRITFSKKQNEGTIMRKKNPNEQPEQAAPNGFYRFLKWFISPISLAKKAHDVPPAPPADIRLNALVQPEPQEPDATLPQVPQAEKTAPSEANRDDIAEAIRRKTEYSNNLDKNLHRKDSYFCFPDLNLSLKNKLFNPSKLLVKDIIDRTEIIQGKVRDVIEQLKNYSLITTEHDSDLDLLEKTSDLKVYELKRGDITVLIVSVYLTLWAHGEKIQLNDAVLNALEEYRKQLKRNLQDIDGRFSGSGLLIGTSDATATPETAENYRKAAKAFCGDSGDFTIYSDYNIKLEKWSIIFPSGWDGPNWWHFAEHLLPIDPADCLKELLEKKNYGFTSTAERLEKNLELPQAIFASAFARLKPALVTKKSDALKDNEGKPVIEYSLAPEKLGDILSEPPQSSNFISDYTNLVISGGSRSIGLILYNICAVVFLGGNAGNFLDEGRLLHYRIINMLLCILLLAFSALLAKMSVEWYKRRIKHS